MNLDELKQDQPYAILPEFLFDSIGDNAKAGMAVIIKDGRIDRVCAAGEVTEDIQTLAGEGGTLIPGCKEKIAGSLRRLSLYPVLRPFYRQYALLPCQHVLGHGKRGGYPACDRLSAESLRGFYQIV